MGAVGERIPIRDSHETHGHCDEVAQLVTFLVSPAGLYHSQSGSDGGRNLWGKTWDLPDSEDMPPLEFKPGSPGGIVPLFRRLFRFSEINYERGDDNANNDNVYLLCSCTEEKQQSSNENQDNTLAIQLLN